MLMALEEFQRNSQQGLAICLEAHSSLHQSQVRDVRKRRESAQQVLALRLMTSVARNELRLAFQSSRPHDFAMLSMLRQRTTGIQNCQE
jgi:hypothetical protein